MTGGIRTNGMVFLAALVALLAIACRRESEPVRRTLEFDAFVPVYNRYISQWLQTQQAQTDRELARSEADLDKLPAGPARNALESRIVTLRNDAEKWRFRQGLGDYLKMAKPTDVPADLAWQNGMDQPEIGDPAAVKGGVFRRFIPTFPPTIRPFGDNSNNSFRGDLYDSIDMALVSLHPETMELIPGLAREWAVAADGRTIYFRIDPAARYSDGEPVRARDFMIGLYLRASDYVTNPSYKQFFREDLAQLAVYDELTLSVTLPEAKIYAPAIAGAIPPASPAFYTDYGADYNERYQWRFPPSTGAYEVRPNDIIKGASITQTRVANWWAKDRKYYRYRYNPDKIVHTVVRDESKAFELFRAGEIDTYYLTRPALWYEKSEMDPVYRGYIERVTFYNRYPKVPLGLYCNVTKVPLDDRQVRIGIQHAMNWQKVIEVMYRGDYQRLNAFNEGYQHFSDPSIRARPYDVEQARAAFRTAGYTQEGRDGILTKPDGTRLTAAVTYPSMPNFDRLFAILREDARACGFDLRLDGLEATVAYKKEMQKQHELAFGSWLITPPVPEFYQFLHSSNAFDEKGNIKPQSNNTFVWGRPDTDRLCEQVRNGRNAEEIRVASQRLQHIIHDEAIFVPGYSVDFVRIGSWRWVRWPDSASTKFSPPVVYDPHEAFVFWIDEAMKKETTDARRSGRAFGESTRVVDVYRQAATKTPAAPSEPVQPVDASQP